MAAESMLQDNSIEQQASGTALATAFIRAFAAADPRLQNRGRDCLAEIFLTDEQKKPLKDPASRDWVIQNRLTPGAYEFMIARSAFFDQVFERALADQTAQIVLLGAGYDSRPYRFCELIGATSIFELDTNPTQRRKKACLQQAHIPIPEQVHFLPVDFERDDLPDRLLEAGFDREKRTCFLWEGVSYYLTTQAVNQMLSFVRSYSPPGSTLSFDYAAISKKALHEKGAIEIRKLLQSQHADEPTRFGIPAGEIEAYLARRGFEVSTHLSAAEMQAKCLAGEQYAGRGKVPELFCLVQARVADLSRS